MKVDTMASEISTRSIASLSASPSKKSSAKKSNTTAVTYLLAVLWMCLCGALVKSNANIWIALASSIAFGLFRLYATPLIASDFPMFTKFTSDQKVLWMNTFVSLVHSTLSSILVILLVCFDQVLFENRVQNIDAYSFAVVAISTGYFAYDLWDLVETRIYVKSPGLIVHHVAVLTCYISSLHKTVGVPYLILTLTLELNSVFLHWRKLLSMLGYNLKDQGYQTIWSFLWITFVACRIVMHNWILYLVYQDRALFPHWIQFGMAFSGLLLINFVNLELLRGVAGSYRKEKKMLRA